MYKIDLEKLGAKFLKSRSKIDYKQDFSAKIAGIYASRLCDIEKGRAMPSLEEGANLARLYGKDINYFLRGTLMNDEYKIEKTL